MPAYLSPIKIDRTPQKKRMHKTVKLPNELLTLDDISKHLKPGDKFSFRNEIGSWYDTTYLDIFWHELETPDEIETRVQKAEAYNKKREEFNAIHRK